MIAAEKRHEDDLYAALWKQDEQVKAAREVAETAEQLKRNQGRKSTVYKVLQKFYKVYTPFYGSEFDLKFPSLGLYP